VRALEQAGVIGSYVALLNQLSLGFGVSVFIQIQLDKQVRRALDQFEAAMRKHPAVMECYIRPQASEVSNGSAVAARPIDQVNSAKSPVNSPDRVALTAIELRCATDFARQSRASAKDLSR
jgi:hypothetical protein